MAAFRWGKSSNKENRQGDNGVGYDLKKPQIAFPV